jgi:ATP-dependent Clp protease ATP-binding subunit ClpC
VFELLTDESRRVYVRAAEHARALKHDHLGVEHVLLALVDFGRGPVVEALFALNASPRDIWTQTLLLASGSETVEQAEHLPFTPGAKRALGLSVQQSRQLHHNHVGPEHLLLGLLGHLDDPWTEPEATAEVLDRIGVSLSRLRQELLTRIPSD